MSLLTTLALLLLGGAYGWLSVAQPAPARWRTRGTAAGLAALVIWLAWQTR